MQPEHLDWIRFIHHPSVGKCRIIGIFNLFTLVKGKEKGRDTTDMADSISAMFVVPRPGGGLLRTPSGSVGTSCDYPAI